MPLHLSDAAKERMYATLQAHFRDHFEIELGLLQFDRLLDAFLRSVGAGVYNQAVLDAQAYLHGKLLDMEADLHEAGPPE